jgi:hypothetical protein
MGFFQLKKCLKNVSKGLILVFSVFENVQKITTGARLD